MSDGPKRSAAAVSLIQESRLSAATRLSRPLQQEIFEHELVVAARKRAAAGSAAQLPIVRFRSGFDLNDVVERLAVRAREGIRRRRPSRRHTRPHTQKGRLNFRRDQSMPAKSGSQLSHNCHGRSRQSAAGLDVSKATFVEEFESPRPAARKLAQDRNHGVTPWAPWYFPPFIQYSFQAELTPRRAVGGFVLRGHEMKTALIALSAAVIVVGSTLAFLNNACKSSQHSWCAPNSSARHHAKLS